MPVKMSQGLKKRDALVPVLKSCTALAVKQSPHLFFFTKFWPRKTCADLCRLGKKKDFPAPYDATLIGPNRIREQQECPHLRYSKQQWRS